MHPRPYQQKLIDDARLKLREITLRLRAEGIERKPRLMVQSGCGSGKTALSAFIARSALDNGGTVAFLAHRNFLIDQTSKTYARLNIQHSYLAAGKPLNPRGKVHLGMIGSMRSRQGKIKPPSVCFVDEAHHAVARSYKDVIEAWPETTFICLSATPGARTDGKGLNEICDDIVCGPSNRELISIGALSDYRWYQGTPPAELMALKLSGSDSADKQAEILDKPMIIGDVVGTYRQKAMGKKAVYFAPNVKMSMDLAQAFTDAGLPFAHMDKDTESWKRKVIARDIAAGRLLGFTNVAIATEGFDLAAQAGTDVTIEVAGLVRRTQSLPLLIQMAMRAMRAKPTPGVILDHCGNYDMHQWLPDDDIEWTLDGAVRKPREARPLQCPHCLATDYPEGNTCRHCGGNMSDRMDAERKRVEMEVIEGQMLEVRREQEAQQAAIAAAQAHEKKVDRWKCKTEDDWVAYAVKYGIKSPKWWAKQQMSGWGKRRAG